MDKAVFERVTALAGIFPNSSLQYSDFEDLEGYHVETANTQIVLLLGYDAEAKCHHYHWATDNVDILIPLLTCPEPFLLTFVPPEWVPDLEAAGLKVRSRWHDYFRPTLNDIEPIPDTELDFLTPDKVQAASALTLQCKGQTRGFTGQTLEWFERFMQGDETVKDPAVIVQRTKDDEIIGLVCTGTYGHEGKNGPVVWIREVAVSPQHQNRGIGRKLVSQALRYGKRCGATRAFLAVDEDNLGAIHLYESLGFVASEEPGEINMIKK